MIVTTNMMVNDSYSIRTIQLQDNKVGCKYLASFTFCYKVTENNEYYCTQVYIACQLPHKNINGTETCMTY